MKYNLIVTENQARILNRACDTLSRLIEGQFSELCDLLEDDWMRMPTETIGCENFKENSYGNQRKSTLFL